MNRIIKTALVIFSLSLICQVSRAHSIKPLQVEDHRARALKLALRQSEKMTADFDPSQRDCAGFVRYVLREATQSPAQMWLNKSHQLVNYVGAEELIGFNFTKLGRNTDLLDLKTGDILVYYSENKKLEDRFHLMMILKNPINQSGFLVAYHNGKRDQMAEIRRVSLHQLQTSPNSEWQPLPNNPNFLGIYRWKKWTKNETVL